MILISIYIGEKHGMGRIQQETFMILKGIVGEFRQLSSWLRDYTYNVPSFDELVLYKFKIAFPTPC